MNLSPGTRLGSYEIVAALGAGGMGEVYRARDVRLGRDVAVKVIAGRLARDLEAVARFEREAKAIAALSHPNVLALFDYGESDGTLFAVSELLEGETLRARLAAGALSQRKAVEIAVQIARGLAAAHERGITHRDLKPENVFLTRDGHVKILDFGLARLTGAGGASIESAGPTLVRPTDPGRVMGTAGYMAPEQVRGEEADHRSDLFAFGAVLYEMLAGRRAFRGESAVETMTATLREEPPELPTSVSSALDRILRHCLEKRPEERFRSAHDLAFDLETLADLSTAGSRGALPSVTKSGRPTAPLLLVLLLVAAAAVGAALARWLWSAAPPAPPVFRQLTFRRGLISMARFTPDGGTIVYSAAWDGNPLQLFTTRIERPESSLLALPSADLLAVSRSGEIALSLGEPSFSSGHPSVGTLASIPLAGGAPREILQGVYQADWAPDGSNLAVIRLSAGGGESRLEYPIGKVLLRSANYIRDLRVSPGGEFVAAFELLTTGYRLVVFNRAGRQEMALPLRDGFPLGLAWYPTGEEIWYSARGVGGSGLYAVRLDGEQRLVHRSAGWTNLYDISHEGKLLVGNHFLRHGIAALPPGEARERDLSWFEQSLVRDLSDDGRTLLFDEEGYSGKGRGVYLRAMDGSLPIHLGAGRASLLSPDGRWVLALTADSLVLLPTGAGEPKPLPKKVLVTSGSSSASSWFPDGRRILLAGREPRNPTSRLYIQDLTGGKPRAVTPPGFGFSFTYAARPLSPDGRQVVAMAPNGRLWIYPLTGGVPRLVAGFEPGDSFLRWSGDGTSLFVWRRDPPGPRVGTRVFRLDLTTSRKEPWLEIRPPDPAGINRFVSLVLTPDGKSYAYTYGRVLSDLYIVDGLK